MKILWLIILISSLSQAQDASLFRDLNLMAEQVFQAGQDCAEAQQKNFSDLYVEQFKNCEQPDLRTHLQNFRTSVGLIAHSGFAEAQEAKYKLHPLVIQVLFEHMSVQAFDRVLHEGGTSGVGICLGFLSIGFCESTPKTHAPAPLSDSGERFLRFLSAVDSDNCGWGLWPSLTAQMVAELLEYQTPSQTRRYGNTIVVTNIPFGGESDAQVILWQKLKALRNNCPQTPWKGSALEFFRKFNP